MDLFRTAAGDEAGRGISLSVDQMGVFNYALYQNHISPVRGISVFNETGVPAEGLALHILSDVHFFAECTIPLPAVPSGKPVTVSDPALMIDGKMLAGLTEETATAVTVELLKDGECICGCREEMRVLAYDQWQGGDSYQSFLASFVLMVLHKLNFYTLFLLIIPLNYKYLFHQKKSKFFFVLSHFYNY